MITLEDMSGLTEKQVKDHLAEYYSDSKENMEEMESTLSGLDVLVAYESVGNWGCDSSSWFLLKDKKDESLYVISGSHCSCYGFEGQGELELTDPAYLQSDRFYLPVGGYDDSADDNKKVVKRYFNLMFCGTGV